MDDNATCHRTLAVQDCLDSEGIQHLVWPVRSPDLNPIENVWDALGRQVAGRNYPPTNKNTLIRALTEEWDKLPQQLLDNVVQKFYIQWIPSYIGIISDGIAESLEKAATLDTPQPDMPLTFSEVFSDSNKKQRDPWRIPNEHASCTDESTLVVPYSLKVIDVIRLAYLDLLMNT
ncbi:uncharacterized protein TNCV_903871 [Trichonephila clavipes]|nr:uncharacterized protein TNCV_903871 [Trichonephila clavipes]